MWDRLLGVILLLSFAALSACHAPNLLNAVSPSAQPQDPCGFVQNAYGERISWKDHTPVHLSIHQSVPSSYYPAIEAAIKDWETALGRPVFQIDQYSLAGPATPRQDGVNAIYLLNTWEATRSNEQARTSVYWVGNEIQEADVRIDAKNFTFYVTNPASPNDVHLESLILHELGHVLGLKHNDTGGSVMATYLSANTVRNQVGAKDLNSVHCEY